MENQPQPTPQQPLSKKERKALRRAQRAQEQLVRANSKRSGMLVFWAVIVLIIGATVFGIYELAKNGGAPRTTTGTIPAIAAADNVTGSASSTLTLVEYSDFQCPACGAYYPLVKRVATEFQDRIRFVYRNYPLTTLHPNAQIAAQAAAAAGLQNKFWQMHDLLFENQTSWSSLSSPKDKFYEYAAQIGLNVEQFKKDISASAVTDKIAADVSGANSAGVNATPTFFLNGVAMTNPRSYEEFKALLESALAKR